MKTQVTYLIHNQTQQDIHLGYWVSTIPGISSQEYKVIQNNTTLKYNIILQYKLIPNIIINDKHNCKQ